MTNESPEAESPGTESPKARTETSEPKRGQNELPLWLRVSIISALSVTLIVHIFVDVIVDTYDGAATSLMLGGIVGTALGINEFVKGR